MSSCTGLGARIRSINIQRLAWLYHISAKLDGQANNSAIIHPICTFAHIGGSPSPWLSLRLGPVWNEGVLEERCAWFQSQANWVGGPVLLWVELRISSRLANQKSSFRVFTPSDWLDAN